MGCKECEFRVFRQGRTECVKMPRGLPLMEASTVDQHAIAAWLTEPGRNEWTDSGCPGFKQWAPTSPARPPSAG